MLTDTGDRGDLSPGGLGFFNYFINKLILFRLAGGVGTTIA
jgi:hypothetical protein